MRRSRQLGLALLAGLGCEPEAQAPPVGETRDEAEARDIGSRPAWIGCDDYVGDTCLLGAHLAAHPLRFWVDVPPSTELAIELDGTQVADVSSQPSDAGTRYQLEIARGTRALTVAGPGVDGTLRFVWHERHPLIQAGIDDLDAGRAEQGCAALRRLPKDAPAFDRVVARKHAEACGEVTDAASAIRVSTEMAELAEAGGLRRSFIMAASNAMHTQLAVDMGSAAVDDWTTRMTPQAAGWPELEVYAEFARMLVAWRNGDFVEALAAAGVAARWADRLGMPEQFLILSEMRTTILAELGRVEEVRAASAALATTADEQTDACQRARVLTNATWPQQILADAGFEKEPPLDRMQQIAAIYESGECDDPYGRAIARINLAFAALSETELELATDVLDRIFADDEMTMSPGLAAQVEYVVLGVALATNRWDRAAIPLLSRAPIEGDARMRWHVAVRQAQVLEHFGLEDAALDAWRQAEALLDEEAATIGVSAGREAFISGRTTSAIGFVEALLRRGAVDSALCRARIARGRALRRAVRDRRLSASADIVAFDRFLREREALERDAADDWLHAGDELARRRARREERRTAAMAALAIAMPGGVADSDCAALRPRGEHELLVLVLPTRDDTLAIIDGPGGARGGAKVERLASIPDDDAAMGRWAEELLERIAPLLDDVTLVRVLPVGRAWSVPFHATTLRGAPIVERVAVAYGLDLPVTRTAEDGRAAALVVADPTGDLPHATNEGDRVRTLLRQHEMPAELLTGAAARREDVLAALAGVELFHYSGHGEHRGSDGWDDALLLHDRASIESADVLALAHAPRTVVLAGCDTGAVNAGLFDGGMSLGRAFLLAGSEAVVVGDRKVDDAVTESFAVALYEGSAQRMLDAPELAVRDALRATAASGVPVSAWSGFRLLVR